MIVINFMVQRTAVWPCLS